MDQLVILGLVARLNNSDFNLESKLKELNQSKSQKSKQPY